MAEPVDIDKTTAAEALRAATVHYDDPDSADFGRTLIHCFLGFIGADWDLDHALRTLSKADRVCWSDHLLGHDLAVVSGGKLYRFDIKRPETVA